MSNKVSKFLLFAWTLVLGLVAFAMQVFAVAGGEEVSSAVSGDSCGWLVGLAIGFLLIGSAVVLIVVHKKRSK